MRRVAEFGLAAGMLLLGLGPGSAEASVDKLLPPQSLGIGSAVMPAAMCGFRCGHGGFYVPGPPEVCFVQG